MAWSALFGPGTLTIGTTDIPVQNLSMEDKSDVIELMGNEDFPLATANGKRDVSGSFTVGGYESSLFGTITAQVMAPITSATALSWELPAQGGGTRTFSANVLITGTKISSGNDKFMTMEVSYKVVRGAAGAIVTETTGT